MDNRHIDRYNPAPFPATERPQRLSQGLVATNIEPTQHSMHHKSIQCFRQLTQLNLIYVTTQQHTLMVSHSFEG